MAFTKVTAAGINTGGSFILENINTSGIITASTVNVGSAVTISSGGANVTGIVTAGTVQVGSATTIHTTGIDLGGGALTSHNINSTGIITSTSGFDGNLTGNVTGDLTGNVTGNVSSSGANTLGSLTVTNDATVGGALTVTGDFTVNGTTTTIDTIVTAVDSLAVDGNVTAGGNLNITGVSTFNGTTEVQDSSFKVTNSNASGQYLQVTQNTNSSLNLDKVGDGAFYIRGNNIYLQNDGTSETYAGFEADGKSYLNYNGSTKLETTGTGVTITGDARVTGILTVGTASVTIDGSQDFPTTRPTLDLNFAATKTLDRRITFTRDSIGTYTDEFGIIQTVPNNVPRFDHDPETGESLGLLIEESRTNYFDYSESTAWENYNGGQTSLEDSTLGILSPTGSTPLVLRPTNTSVTSLLSDRYEAYPSSGGTMIFSVFVKTPTGSQYEEVQLYTSAVYGGNFSASLIFNISTLTTRGATGTAANAGIFDYGNGWYRICMSFTCPASTSGPIQRVSIVDDVVAQGTTQSDGLLIFGYQLELGSFPTSYIPTSGSTVTRNKDIAVIKGTNFTDVFDTNFREFSLLVDYDNSETNDGTFYEILSFWGESTGFNDRIGITKDDQSPYHIETRAFGGGGGVFSNGNLSASSKAATQKFATSWSVPDYSNTSSRRWAFCFSGESPIDVVNDGTGTTVPAVTRLGLGISPTRLAENETGGLIHFKRFAAYNKALTDAQLQSLTRQ
jgi:cytoskeletal protein CcmA (bactofilin family)